MSEQLDLLGGAVSLTPQVPSVTLWPAASYEPISALRKPHCGHCAMLADEYRRAGAPEPPLLRAVYRRTSATGSVLDLCTQHADEQRVRDDDAGLPGCRHAVAALQDLARAHDTFADVLAQDHPAAIAEQWRLAARSARRMATARVP